MKTIEQIAPEIAHRSCTTYSHLAKEKCSFTDQHLIDFATKLIEAWQAQQEPVGYGMFVDDRIVAIGHVECSGHVGKKSFVTKPVFLAPPPAIPDEDFSADACRLALELECLLLDCKDTAVTAKWWESAWEALNQHHELIEQMRREQE